MSESVNLIFQYINNNSLLQFIFVLHIAFDALMLVVILVIINSIKRIKDERKYKFSRTYDKNGDIVNTRWTEVLEDGYWVTVITDENMNLLSEHTRTKSNSLKHKFDSEAQENQYNKNVVWGDIAYKAASIKYKSFKKIRFADKMRMRREMESNQK